MRTATVLLGFCAILSLSGCHNEVAKTEAQKQDEAFLAANGITAASIAKKQGWSEEAAQADMDFGRAMDARQPVDDALWKTVEASAQKYGKSYTTGLVGSAMKSKDPKIIQAAVGWSKALMEQTEDIYAVALGYRAYVRSGQPDAAEWSQKLQARSEEQKKIILETENDLRTKGILK